MVARLDEEVRKAAKSAFVIERYPALGADAVASTPDEFAAYIHQEFVRWAKVVKHANIKF